MYQEQWESRWRNQTGMLKEVVKFWGCLNSKANANCQTSWNFCEPNFKALLWVQAFVLDAGNPAWTWFVRMGLVLDPTRFKPYFLAGAFICEMLVCYEMCCWRDNGWNRASSGKWHPPPCLTAKRNWFTWVHETNKDACSDKRHRVVRLLDRAWMRQLKYFRAREWIYLSIVLCVYEFIFLLSFKN